MDGGFTSHIILQKKVNLNLWVNKGSKRTDFENLLHLHVSWRLHLLYRNVSSDYIKRNIDPTTGLMFIERIYSIMLVYEQAFS